MWINRLRIRERRNASRSVDASVRITTNRSILLQINVRLRLNYLLRHDFAPPSILNSLWPFQSFPILYEKPIEVGLAEISVLRWKRESRIALRSRTFDRRQLKGIPISIRAQSPRSFVIFWLLLSSSCSITAYHTSKNLRCEYRPYCTGTNERVMFTWFSMLRFDLIKYPRRSFGQIFIQPCQIIPSSQYLCKFIVVLRYFKARQSDKVGRIFCLKLLLG